jgi:hypothetical protein
VRKGCIPSPTTVPNVNGIAKYAFPPRIYPGTAAATSAEKPFCQNPVSMHTMPKFVTMWMIPKKRDSLLVIER